MREAFTRDLAFQGGGHQNSDVHLQQLFIGQSVCSWKADNRPGFLDVAQQLAQVQAMRGVDAAMFVADGDDASTPLVHAARSPTAHVAKALDGD